VIMLGGGNYLFFQLLASYLRTTLVYFSINCTDEGQVDGLRHGIRDFLIVSVAEDSRNIGQT